MLRLQKHISICAESMLCQLAFSAGIPLKLIEAMSFGIPYWSVNGTIARHMGLIDGKQVLVADSSQEFAAKVIELYSNESLWQHVKKNSLEYVNENYSYLKMRQRLDAAIKRGIEIKVKRGTMPK